MVDKTIPNLDAVITPAPTDLFGVRQTGDVEDKFETREQVHALEDGEYLVRSFTDNITASFFNNQANATQLTSEVNFVDDVECAGDSIKLPATFPVGAIVEVHVRDTTDAPDLFPFEGDDLGLGVDTPIRLDPNQTVRFIATVADSTWARLFQELIQSEAAAGAIIRPDSAGGFNAPSLIPNKQFLTVGVAASDSTLHLVVNNSNAGHFTSVAGGHFINLDLENGVVANPGGGQGSAVLLRSSYSVVGTVATAGDSIIMPSVFLEGRQIYIKNDGANDLDLFPASGDDLGEGVDTAFSLGAGKSVIFISSVSNSTWQQWAIDGFGAAALIADADGDTQIQVEETADEDIIRFDTGDNVAGYPAAADALLFSSGQFTLALPTANVATTIGGAINLTAGAGNTTGFGGGVNITGGLGASGGEVLIRGGEGNLSPGSGGTVRITGGTSSGTARDGGDIIITGGLSTVAAERGGAIDIRGGIGNDDFGGDVNITGGAAGSQGAGNDGGDVDIQGGSPSTLGGQGGRIHILVPASQGTDTGGIIRIEAGNADTGGEGLGGSLNLQTGVGGGTLDGGLLSLVSGTGGTTGDGGFITLDAGDGGSAGGQGGDIVLTAGDAGASGATGTVDITGGAATGGNRIGGQVTLEGGVGTGFQSGGNARLLGGVGGATGEGGRCLIFGGATSAGSAQGGIVTITGGDAMDAGVGGDVDLTAGGGGGTDSTVGGEIKLTGGRATATNAPGGRILLDGGIGRGTGVGGAVEINGGDTQSGTPGLVDIRGGIPSVLGTGGSISLTGTAGVGATSAGGALNLLSGAGNTSGAGGAINITTGASGAGASGNSGAITIQSGDTTTTGGNVGVIRIQGGLQSGGGTGDGGNIELNGGRGADRGGDVDMTGGLGDTSDGGDIAILTGASTAGGTGGNIDLLIGASNGATFAGGFINMRAGAGATTGAGGPITITGGIAGNTDASVGGAVTITGGTSAATNGDGGDINLTVGPGTGSGVDGNIVFTGDMISATVTGPALLDVAASSTVPSIVPDQGDPDTGIGQAAGNVLTLITGGVRALQQRESLGQVLQMPQASFARTANAGGGQGSADQLGSSYNEFTTVATTGDSAKMTSAFQVGTEVTVQNNGANDMDIFPFEGDDLGAGVDTAVSLRAGDMITYRATAANSTWQKYYPDRLLLLQEDNAASPTLGFGDGDTGFYENGDDFLSVTVAGVRQFAWATGLFQGIIGGAGALLNEATTATNPTLLPFNTDTDTGIGSDGTDTLSLIAGGIEAVRYDENSSFVIQVVNAGVGLTADAGSAQGNGVILASYNVYSTVVTIGDAATLPATFAVGTKIYIKNDAANSMDVFPASGDDLGNGTDTVEAVPGGDFRVYLATAASATWTQIMGGSEA